MLRLDYDALAISAKELRTEGDNFEDCIDKMRTTITGLPDIWEAETSTEYVDQFDKAEITLKEVRQMIEDMATQMEKISANFKAADADMKKQMK
jgi:WXG100 family type VII secretion target